MPVLADCSRHCRCVPLTACLRTVASLLTCCRAQHHQGFHGQNASLTQLDLSNNDLAGDELGTLIGDALANNHVLTNIDVSGNPIGDRGGAELLRLLRRSPSMVSFGQRCVLALQRFVVPS